VDCDLSVDCKQLFGRSLPHFGISEVNRRISTDSSFLSGSIFGLTYFFEEAFSQMKVIKIPKPPDRSIRKILPSLPE